MSLFESLSQWVSRNRDDLILVRVPDAQVSGAPGSSGVLAEADKHYVRITIMQSFLAKATIWFTKLQPIIHGAARLQFGDRTVDLPHVSVGERIDGLDVGEATVLRGVRMTPLLPFRGGDLALQCGLVALPGDSAMQIAAKLLAGAGELIVSAPLATALRVAPLVEQGLREFAGLAKPNAKLGLVETYDKATLRDGYVALVGRPAAKLDAGGLRVVDGSLHIASDGSTRPLTGVDWLLVRIEVTDERDDWKALTAIDAPYREALAATATGDKARSEAALSSAVTAAWQAPELTEVHRTIVVTRMKSAVAERLATAGRPGAVDVADVDLADLVAGADLGRALEKPLRRREDAFADWPFASRP